MIRQWVNIEDEGAPHLLLRRIEARIPAAQIDTLWIFPVRRGAGIESSVIVVSSFEPAETDRRRVSAVRFIVTRDKKGRATVEEQFFDFAFAPADTLPRVVDGVMRRLGDEAVAPPQAHVIQSDAERWTALLRELGAPDPDPASPAQDASPAGSLPA
jgi:hypothetical protein